MANSRQDRARALTVRWQHPWLRIELAIRAIIADRLTRGPSESVDQVLMARIKERERIQRVGWFN